MREEGAGGGFERVEGAERVIRAVISRVPVPGVGGRSDRGLGTGSALAHQRVLKPGGGCEGGGEREARMPVTDWTIQCHARSGALMAGGRRLLTPGRDTAAQCFRAPAWRCRLIPVLAAWGTALGVASAASSAFDLNPHSSRLDDTPNVAFAAPVSAAIAEPNAASLLAGGKTS